MAESLFVAISIIKQTCKIVPLTIPNSGFKIGSLIDETEFVYVLYDHHTMMILSN